MSKAYQHLQTLIADIRAAMLPYVRILQLFLSLGLLAAIAFQLSKQNPQELLQVWKQMSILTKEFWASMFLLGMFFVSVGVPFIGLVKASTGSHVGIIESLGLAIATGFYNMILPGRLGVVMRGGYLSRTKGVGLLSYVAMGHFLSAMGLLALGVVAWFSMAQYKINDALLGSIFFAMIVVGIFGIVVALYPWKKGPLKSYRTQYRALLTTNVLLQTTLCYFGGAIVFALRLMILYKVHGVNFSLSQSLFASSLVLTAGCIQLVPGNLGVKEFSFALVGHFLGHDPAIDWSVAIMDRVLQSSFMLIGGLIFHFSSLQRVLGSPWKWRKPTTSSL